MSRASTFLMSSAFALASLADPALAQTTPNEADVKAAFVYNFLKFVDWPADSLVRPDEPLLIAIIGEGAVADAAEKFLQGKRVGTRPLAVYRLKAVEPLHSIHAVFITGSDTERVQRALATIGKTALLTIGDDANFAMRGGMIALFVDDRRVRFEVNTEATDARGLRVSSRLLALAKVVRPGANARGPRP